MSGILNLLVATVTTIVTVPAFTFQSVVITPTDASASLKLGADGHYYKNVGLGFVDQGLWVDPPFMAQLYEARMVLSSGDTLDAGTVGSYLSLDTDRTWTQSRTSNAAAVEVSTLALDIRRIADSATQGTTTGNTLYAEVTT